MYMIDSFIKALGDPGSPADPKPGELPEGGAMLWRAKLPEAAIGRLGESLARFGCSAPDARVSGLMASGVASPQRFEQIMTVISSALRRCGVKRPVAVRARHAERKDGALSSMPADPVLVGPYGFLPLACLDGEDAPQAVMRTIAEISTPEAAEEMAGLAISSDRKDRQAQEEMG